MNDIRRTILWVTFSSNRNYGVRVDRSTVEASSGLTLGSTDSRVYIQGATLTATGGNLLAWGALGASKTINNGDAAPSFAAGALTFTLA